MRRTFTALAVATLGLTLAQNGWAQVDVSLRGGLSYSHLTGENISTDPKTGFTAGVFGRFGLKDNLGLRAELSYVQKGAKTTSEIFDPVEGQRSIDRTDDLPYLELMVPLDLTLRINNEKVRPHLLAGPSFALALSCTVEATNTEPRDCTNEFKDYDVGLLLGAGVEYGSGPGAFVAELRYDIGFVDIGGDEPAGETQITQKNRSLQLVVGYVRRLGRASGDQSR